MSDLAKWLLEAESISARLLGMSPKSLKRSLGTLECLLGSWKNFLQLWAWAKTLQLIKNCFYPTKYQKKVRARQWISASSVSLATSKSSITLKRNGESSATRATLELAVWKEQVWSTDRQSNAKNVSRICYQRSTRTTRPSRTQRSRAQLACFVTRLCDRQSSISSSNKPSPRRHRRLRKNSNEERNDWR